MRITFRTEGGLAHFPGLARPVTIDTAELMPESARALEDLVAKAGLWNRPTDAAQRPRAMGSARDHMSYILEVDDGARRERVEFSDPVPAELSPLVGRLREESKKDR